jgi:hypothetical protein
MSEPYGILVMSQFEEIYKVVASKDAEIARLRLTDEEREAIEFFADIHAEDQPPHEYAATLRSLLERLS